MSDIVAIDLSASEVTFVRAQTVRGGPVRIKRVQRLRLETLAQAPPNGDLEGVFDEDVDQIVAALPSRRVLFELLSLPFREPKKLDQVVPLQLQDLLPFEMDQFIVDSIVLGKREDGEFDILASLVPREEVRRVLETVHRCGAEVRSVTTKASAVVALSDLVPAGAEDAPFALLVFHDGCYSLVMYEKRAPRMLREGPIPVLSDGSVDASAFLGDLRAVFARFQRTFENSPVALSVVGSTVPVELIERALPCRVEVLDVSHLLDSRDIPHAPSASEFAWVLGLLSERDKKNRILDFRKGTFAYRPAMGQAVAALREEWFYFLLFFLCAALWLGSTIFSTSSAVSRLNDAIRKSVSLELPGEIIPQGEEVNTVQQAVSDLEGKLRSMGTLSSLSPLESLRELSEMIGAGIDVTFESINMGHSRLSMSGTVRDFPTVGKLSSALEKKKGRFCDVKVDPKGQVSASGRVRIAVELKVCE